MINSPDAFVCAATRALGCLVVLAGLSLCVAADEGSESRSGLIHELQAALADLAAEGRTYLGRLAGEQTVLSVQKAFSQVLSAVAGSLAAGLNVIMQHVSQCMQAAGVQLSFPVDKVTPQGVLFVTQWVLLALIGYWLLSFTYCLIASTLRRALWLLKVSAALACFGFILSDQSLDTETRAVRLAVLLLVCMLLGVGSFRGPSVADKTSHLEEQVKILERRLKEIEKWRRTEETRGD